METRHYIIPIFVPHEGCPHNCVFCNQESITGTKSVINSEYVRETIESFLSTIPRSDSVIEVSFFGGTFTAINIAKQCELLSIAKEYKEAKKIKYIRLSTRPDYIDHSILTNLKNHLVDIIELGVQSLDREVLIKSGRGHSEEDVVRASRLIKEYGFTLGHQIMLGLPGDSFYKDIYTAEKCIELAPEVCRIYPALVVKNTPMEKMYLRGEYTPYTLEESIKITKTIYGMLIAKDIKVIRIGLQPTEEINEGKEIVAGPFHPAFRELVEGSILRDMIISAVPKDYIGELKIKINPRDISRLYANKKIFFNDITCQLKTINIKVIQDTYMCKGHISLEFGNECNNMSIYAYLINNYKEGYFDLL